MKNTEKTLEDLLKDDKSTDNAWIFGLLLLLMMNTPTPKSEVPTINIYIGE